MSAELAARRRLRRLKTQNCTNSTTCDDSSRVEALKKLLVCKVRLREKHIVRGFQKVLKSFDADGSGELERHEFEQAMRVYLSGIDLEDVELLRRSFDRDDSGGVSLQEFIDAFRDLEEDLGVEAPELATRPPRAPHPPEEAGDAKIRPPRVPLSLDTSHRIGTRDTDRQEDDVDDWPESEVASSPKSDMPLLGRAQTFEQRLERYLVKARQVLSQKIEAAERNRVRGRRMNLKLPQASRLSLHRPAVHEALAKRQLQRMWAAQGAEDGRLQVKQFEAFLRELLPEGQTFLLSSRDGDVYLLWRMCQNGQLDEFQDLVFTFSEDREAEVSRGPFMASDRLRHSQSHDATWGKQQRITYRHCRTPVYPPTGWDPEKGVELSSKVPDAQLGLRHVFGYRADKQGPNLEICQEGLVVYSVAGVAIVQAITNKNQRFFRGHDDDISCLRIAPRAVSARELLHPAVLNEIDVADDSIQLCVTGQVGKRPFICVWVVLKPQIAGGGGECTELFRMGNAPGQLERMVCAAAFSPDATMVACVGADDKHCLHVFRIGQKEHPELLVQMPTSDGPPPVVQSCDWASWMVSSPKAAQESHGTADLADLLVTSGKRHIKFWTLSKSRRGYLLLGRNGRFGRNNRDVAPKETLRAAFVATGGDDDIEGICLSVGSNGRVFSWRDGLCIGILHAHAGAILSMCIRNPREVYTAGTDGEVKKWSLPELQPKRTFAVPEEAEMGGLNNPVSDGRAPDGSIIERDSEEYRIFTRRILQEEKEAGEAREKAYQDKQGPPTIQDKIRTLREKLIQTKKDKSSPPISDLVVWNGPKGSSEIIVMGSARGTIMAIKNSRNGTVQKRLLAGSHFGQVWGLAMHPSRSDAFATCGHDRRVAVWSSSSRSLVCARQVPKSAHSLDWHPQGTSLAVGFRDGAFAVFECSFSERELIGKFAIRHCREDIDDLKYSPNGAFLAVTSHDQYIDVYNVRDAYSHRCRLQGHSSYLTHVDWSKDSQILQSNCGAYELLYWNPLRGSQLKSTKDSVEADTLWATWTCVLGFPVMGIWMPDSDGTDVNACHRTRDGRLLVTADDFGAIRLYNAPVVVNHAPHRAYKGHSAHVMNVRFDRDEKFIVSVGGNDKGVFLWEMARANK